MSSHPHSTVKSYFLSSAFWMFIGASMGFIGAVELVAPDLLGNIPWIVFGRVRQIHTNLVMFGFVGSALIGGAHYLVPTLLRTTLHSERIGKITVLLWNLAMAAGVVDSLHGLYPEPGIRRIDLADRYGGFTGPRLDFLQFPPDRQKEAGKSSLRLGLVCFRRRNLHLFQLLLRKRGLEPGHRRHHRDARRRPGLVLRPQHSRFLLHPSLGSPGLLHYPHRQPGASLQSHPVSNRFLVHPSFLFPHRDPSSLAGPRPDLAQGGGHHRQRGHADPGHDRFDQPLVHHARPSRPHPLRDRREIRLCRDGSVLWSPVCRGLSSPFRTFSG